jgi:hypothetical protein
MVEITKYDLMCVMWGYNETVANANTAAKHLGIKLTREDYAEHYRHLDRGTAEEQAYAYELAGQDATKIFC